MAVIKVKRFFRLKDQVTDTWYTDFGTGIIVKVTKSSVHVQFSHAKIRYDKPHCKFLKLKAKRVKKRTKNVNI